ncbi:unnamed protein product [Phytophthora lilii]|uniref:RNA-directed DNA polymerase n=1 Tax=Phytophthora lilii TaxID=2077276 RepID=A0A9W6TCW0_9STRA|nr:unnamed protein product [Phytophthora lilii]
MEETIQVALQEEYSHKQAHTPLTAWHVNATPGRAPNGGSGYEVSGGPEPMDLGLAEQRDIRCYACGECRIPVGAGLPTGENLSLHERCAGGAHHGGLAPESLCTLETEKGSGGLLVVHASVRGYSNPFRVLIDSGASKNFARRQTVARNGDKFADTLRENEGNGLDSVRLADGTVVEVPRVHMDLAVKFEDFDSTEQFIGFKMDKYDLILGMLWLEKHEPWIGWRGKTIGASRPAVSDRAWVTSEVLAGVVEEKSDPDAEVAVRDATGRRTRSTTDWAPCPACEPVIPTGLDAESRRALRASTASALLSADELGNKGHQRVTEFREQQVLQVWTITDEEVAESASCVGNLVPHDADNIVPHEAEISEESVEDASCVGNVVPRMVEMTEESEVVIDTSGVANAAPYDASEARNAPLREASHVDNMESCDGRRQRPCQVSGPVTNPASVTEGDTEPGAPTEQAVEKCYHIFDGESGREMSMVDFLAELKAGEIAEMVLLRPELSPEEINSSSVTDEAVLEELKKRGEARLGSEVLKNPKDPVYPLLTEFADVVSKDPPSQLPPDRGIRHEIDLVPYKVLCHQTVAFASRTSEVIDAFFAAKAKAGMVRESKSLHSTPTFCVRKPNGKWRLVYAYNKLNSATVPAQTPIPRKSVLLSNLAGCTLFSALGLVDGHYQILMRESDIPLTAVSTPSGMLWEWLVIPQGLSNAPATFNRLVTQLFRPLRAFVQTYFDDIFVHSRAEEGKTAIEVHLEHLRRVLEIMRANKLYANIDKCVFAAERFKSSAALSAARAAERIYPVHDKELLAMKYALVKFRVHLLGSRPFVIFTDHASLRTATSSPHLSQWMARWLSFFAEYNFRVKYEPGKLTVLADALSRRPDYELAHISQVTTDLYDRIRLAYRDDDSLAPLVRYFTAGTDAKVEWLSPRQRAQLYRDEWADGLHYRVEPNDPPQIVVPNDEDLKFDILLEVHDTPIGGHLGREKTFLAVSETFLLAHMYKWVSNHVKTCETCQRVKPAGHASARLQSLPVPSDCWKSMSLDFVFGLSADDRGNTGISVFVCRLRKMVHLAPVPETVTGELAARLFLDNVFRYHRLPETIVSDRDPRLTAAFWQTLFRLLGTRLTMSTADHPQTDGQTERVNRVLEDPLRSVCAEMPHAWAEPAHD